MEWISLIEKKPNYSVDTPCLVFGYWAKGQPFKFVDDWEPEYQEFEQSNKRVTHWMPMPESPKEIA